MGADNQAERVLDRIARLEAAEAEIVWLRSENARLIADAADHDKYDYDTRQELARLNRHINKLDAEIEKMNSRGD